MTLKAKVVAINVGLVLTQLLDQLLAAAKDLTELIWKEMQLVDANPDTAFIRRELRHLMKTQLKIVSLLLFLFVVWDRSERMMELVLVKAIVVKAVKEAKEKDQQTSEYAHVTTQQVLMMFATQVAKKLRQQSN